MIKTLLILAALASAQTAPIEYRDFSGGINTSQPASTLKENETPASLNVSLDVLTGALVKRKGRQTCGTIPSNSPVTNGIEYFKSDGVRRLVVTDNTNVYETQNCQSFTTVVTGLDPNVVPNMRVVRDKVWIVQRSTHPMTWDSSTLNYLDGSPASEPDPIEAQFIEYENNRVWLCRAPDSGYGDSACQFSALTDNLGNLVEPDASTHAWKSTNIILVNEDDGDILYGVSKLRGRIIFFKQYSTYELTGQDEFSFGTQRVLSIGTRFANAFVEVEGGLLFVGPDGVYAMDGQQAVRLTDKWYTDFADLAQPNVKESFISWTDGTDFDDGTLTNTSTQIVSGAMVLGTNHATSALLNGDIESDPTPGGVFIGDPPYWTKEDGSAMPDRRDVAVACGGLNWGFRSVAGRFATPAPVTNALSLLFAKSLNWGNPSGSVGNTVTVEPEAYSSTFTYHGGSVCGYTRWLSTESLKSSISFSSYTVSVVDTLGAHVVTLVDEDKDDNHDWTQYCATPSDAAYGERLRIKVKGKATLQAGYPCTSIWGVAGSGASPIFRVYLDSFTVAGSSATGNWESNPEQASSENTQWMTFEVDQDLNGGTIQWQYRINASSTALSTTPYVNISPGAQVSGTTGATWIQVNSTWTAAGGGALSPQVRQVRVNYQSGSGSTQQIVMKLVPKTNNVWFSGASANSTTNDHIWVRQRAQTGNAWWKYDHALASMFVWNDNLYGGSSTNGKIYRLEFGNRDDSTDITSYWQSRDETCGAPSNYHTLRMIDLDYHRTGTPGENIQFGISRNEGSSWSSKTIFMNEPDAFGRTSGRYRKKLWYEDHSLQHRFRIFHDDASDQFKVYGFRVMCEPAEYLGQ